MSDKLAAFMLLTLLLLGIGSTSIHAYRAWFKSDEFTESMKNRFPAQRIELLSRWIDTPAYLWISRIMLLFGVLVFIFVLAFTIWPIILTLFVAE